MREPMLPDRELVDDVTVARKACGCSECVSPGGYARNCQLQAILGSLWFATLLARWCVAMAESTAAAERGELS